MPDRWLCATFWGADPARSATFWATLLNRQVQESSYGLLVLDSTGRLHLRFAQGSTALMTRPSRMHLHLASNDTDHQRQTVAHVLTLGGQHLDVGQKPDEGHVVLSDPGGNAFCVIEPDNRWLEGCGFLAELACDGSRAVGGFWSQVLEWPLVWDRDGETAIQPPGGGIKIAWGGPSPEPATASERQHLDVMTAGDRQGEVDRLVRLGATVLDDDEQSVHLVDPDGFPFRALIQPADTPG